METLVRGGDTSPSMVTCATVLRHVGAVRTAASSRRKAAGIFYSIDKPPGAVACQQPCAGARGSGTNDKACSILMLVRWVSARNIKETFSPPVDYKYPFMAEE